MNINEFVEEVERRVGGLALCEGAYYIAMKELQKEMNENKNDVSTRTMPTQNLLYSDTKTIIRK